jgi:hypothetical protein
MPRFVLFPVVLVFAAFLAAPLPGQLPVDDPALAAARKRQETIKTVEVKFKETELLANGAISENSRSKIKPTAPVPAEDMIIESMNRLVIDGDKLRFENNHPSWRDRGKSLYHRTQISVFDGSRTTDFFPKNLTGDGTPIAVYHERSRYPELWFYLTPLPLAVRGVDSRFSQYSLGTLKPAAGSLAIDGDMCREYTVVSTHGPNRHVWIDTNKSYSIRRIVTERNGQPESQIDIALRKDEIYGWLPATWIYQEYSWKGTLLETFKIEIMDMKINEPQAAEQFTIQFPEGCRVTDNPTNKTYVVQADGSLQPIDDTPTETLPVKSPRWMPNTIWLVTAIGLSFVALLAVVVMRRSNSKNLAKP